MAIVTLLISAALIGLDQITKYWMIQNLMPVGSMPFIKGFIRLEYHENTGAAFGFLAGKGQTITLAIVTGVALLALLIYLLFRRPKSKMQYISLILIFSGGVGNLIDRVMNQKVVDFFCFEFINFPIFNIADICITTAFFIIIVSIILSEIKTRKNPKEQLNDDDNKK